MLTLEAMREDYDWKEAFAYAGKGNVSKSLGATCSDDGIDIGDVVRIIAESAGENDGPEWLMVFEAKDGRFGFLAAGCDYTGWDCQAGGSTVVADTLADLIQYGLTDEARERLKGQLG
jgi:hypothetical protein